MSTPGEIPKFEVIAGSFDDADERNIPVGVTLISPSDTDDGRYELRADNYMPFKDKVEQWYYGVAASDPEVLRRIVAEQISPLYALTVDSLTRIAKGSTDSQVWYDNNPETDDNNDGDPMGEPGELTESS